LKLKINTDYVALSSSGWSAAVQATRLQVFRLWELIGYARQIFLIMQLKRSDVAPIVAFIQRDFRVFVWMAGKADPGLAGRTNKSPGIR